MKLSLEASFKYINHAQQYNKHIMPITTLNTFMYIIIRTQRKRPVMKNDLKLNSE